MTNSQTKGLRDYRAEFESKFGHLGINYSLRKGIAIWIESAIKEAEARAYLAGHAEGERDGKILGIALEKSHN